MARRSYDEKLRQLHALAAKRWRDLEVIAKAPDGREIWRAGGRWDRALRRYTGPARAPVVMQLNEAQIEAAEAFAAWLRAYKARAPRLREIALTGPRGPGKTHLAVMALVAVAYAEPGAPVWLCSPTFTVRHELDRILSRILPSEADERGWIKTGWSARDLIYYLPNGSQIIHKSADKPLRLKDGGFAIAVANEFAMWKSEAASMMVGGLRNEGERPRGLFVPTWNPATADKGAFTSEHTDQFARGDLDGLAQIYRLDPAKNPTVEAGYIGDIDRLIRSFGRDDIADADALGIERRSSDLAFAAFRPWASDKMRTADDGQPRPGHVGAPPELGHVDVTRELTKKLGARAGCRLGAPLVLGADFQGRPHCTALPARLLRRPDGGIVYHVVDEVIAGSGSASDELLAQRLVERINSGAWARWGVTSTADVLVIGDGTGADQDARHEHAGRTSFGVLREFGLIVRPTNYPVAEATKSEAGRNPDVKASLAQCDDIMLDDRLYVDPSCSWFVEAARKCKVRINSGAWRMDDRGPGYSHVLDAFRYIANAVEPARGPVRKPARVLYERGAAVPRRV